MKAERLLRAIEAIDDTLIAEASPAERTRAGEGRRPVWQYVSLAACAALVLASLLLLGEHGGVAPPPLAQVEPDNQAVEEQTPLTLNQADGQIGTDIYIPGHFYYDLTQPQLEAVFPECPLPLTARVHYRGDGTVHHLVAYETEQGSDEAAMFMDYYTRTEIQIAPGEIVTCVVYEYETQTSDVNGVAVTAGVFRGDEIALYLADFQLNGLSYRVSLYDSTTGSQGQTRLTELVYALVRGGAADLSGLENLIIPELRDELLTWEDAQLDADFGAYLPKTIPSNFAFDSARRLLNQEIDALFLHWYAGYDALSWTVSKADEDDLARVVTAQEEEKYDLSRYPIPRADSVPQELREVVDCPVFRAEELTLELVASRAYQVEDRGDSAGVRMEFAVLYGDVVVEISCKGASPEEVWNMLT